MAVVMGWTCLHQHPQQGEWKGEERVNSGQKMGKSLTHYCCGQSRLDFQNWKHLITNLGIGNQSKLVNSLWKGEKRGFPNWQSPLLTSMSPLPSCHSRLHPIPLVRQQAAQGLGVTTECCSPWFPCVCSGRENNPNAILLCLFYLIYHTLWQQICI